MLDFSTDSKIKIWDLDARFFNRLQKLEGISSQYDWSWWIHDWWWIDHDGYDWSWSDTYDWSRWTDTVDHHQLVFDRVNWSWCILSDQRLQTLLVMMYGNSYTGEEREERRGRKRGRREREEEGGSKKRRGRKEKKKKGEKGKAAKAGYSNLSLSFFFFFLTTI